MSTLRGALQSISLVDVLQLLQVNRKTGRLVVRTPEATGTLFVVQGEVVHAEAPDVHGESAAFDILEWTTGEFEFITSGQKVPTTIRRPLHDLLMEGARTSDSRKRLKAVFPNLHLLPWPTLPEPQLTAGLRVYAEDRRVLFYLDGFRSFLEVMDASGQPEVAVLQACHTLLEGGRLQVLHPHARVEVVLAKGGLFRRATHLELSTDVEARWRELGPYAHAPLGRVKLNLPEGPAIEEVRFNTSLAPGTLSVPRELMQSLGLSEGMEVTIRPQP